MTPEQYAKHGRVLTIPLLGQRFGRLLVVHKFFMRGHSGGVVWTCLCDCGKASNVEGYSLRCGKTRSCGCYRRERTANILIARTHGHTMNGWSLTYSSWASMMRRCTNPKERAYPYYGGRQPNPVTVFPAWLVFENFLDYLKASGVGERPVGLTLDRIDPWGSYVPGNIKWSTSKEQNNNRRPWGSMKSAA